MANPLSLIFGLVMFGAMLGLLAVLVRSLAVAVTLPRRMSAEAACDRCKYPIAGLGGWTCPECGADLRRVGIATPTLEMKRRGSTGDAVAAWTLLAMIGGSYVGSGLIVLGPASGPAATLVIIAVVALIWGAGVWGIVARRRAMRRRHGIEPADLRQTPPRG